MKNFLLILLVSGFYVGFAQNKNIDGVWVEYKREIVGDTNFSKYTINGARFHPSLLLTITNQECIYSTETKTDLMTYFVKGDTLTLTGFEKQIFKREYVFSKPSKKELVLTEIITENTAEAFKRKHYFRKSHQYPQKRNIIYIVDKKKDLYPMFPGGPDSLKSFFARELTIPSSLDSVKFKEVVTIMLAFSQEGTILNAEVVGNAWSELVKEAIRMIKLMPKWDMGYESEPKKAGKQVQIKPSLTFYPIEIIFSNKP